MSKAKLTPWFPASVKPVHVGVYEVNSAFARGKWYAKWNGKWWCFASQGLNGASISRMKSHNQTRDWRGLAEKPE